VKSKQPLKIRNHKSLGIQYIEICYIQTTPQDKENHYELVDERNNGSKYIYEKASFYNMLYSINIINTLHIHFVVTSRYWLYTFKKEHVKLLWKYCHHAL